MKANDTVRVDTWAILSRAVSEGSAMGVMRAYKYTDKPDREAIQESVEREVMNAIAEVLVLEP